jgi:mannose-6-phosphate isomerase-like protein (cupin superfamily)
MTDVETTKPVILEGGNAGGVTFAGGTSFEIHEWTGGGPPYLHVHYGDDEAWHVLEGTLTFRFPDGEVKAGPGATVFVPAGLPHTYDEADGPTRYLIILTPRLRRLIEELHRTPFAGHGDVMTRYESAIV